jgi:hypothetical protein
VFVQNPENYYIRVKMIDNNGLVLIAPSDGFKLIKETYHDISLKDAKQAFVNKYYPDLMKA